jgi:hypothetical protein
MHLHEQPTLKVWHAIITTPANQDEHHESTKKFTVMKLA